MIKIIKNNTGSMVSIPDVGQDLEANEELTIDPSNYRLYRKSSDVLVLITDGTLTVNNGDVDLSISDGIDLIKGNNDSISVDSQPPFASKSIGAKKIFQRVHGKSYSLSIGVNILDFAIPYPQIKFNEVEIIGGELGDTCNLKILDTAAGTYTSVPNYQLNQFGFDVNVGPGYYDRSSNYDADLYQGMRICAEYDSKSAKTVYINYILHELKD